MLIGIEITDVPNVVSASEKYEMEPIARSVFSNTKRNTRLAAYQYAVTLSTFRFAALPTSIPHTMRTERASEQQNDDRFARHASTEEFPRAANFTPWRGIAAIHCVESNNGLIAAY